MILFSGNSAIGKRKGVNMFKPTKILAPTDMSAHSDKAVKQAIDIARQFGAQLYLLHVIQDPVQQCTIDYSVSEGLLMQLKNEMMEAAEKGIRGQIEKFPEAKELTVTTDVKSGAPYDMILQEEAERGIDLDSHILPWRHRTGQVSDGNRCKTRPARGEMLGVTGQIAKISFLLPLTQAGKPGPD